VLAVRPGELALSLGRHYVGSRRFVGTLARRRLGSEESPREVATDIEEADWDPAGNDMVVARRLGGSVESVLEYPIGHAVFSSTGGIRSPRMSRDGRRIAFLHDPGGTGGGRVAVVDLAGAMTELTEHWPSARGLAWSPGGDEVWFAAAEGRANRALRGVSLAKRQRVVLQAPSSLTLWDVTRDGSVLLARDDDRNALVGLAPGWKEERDLSWFDASGVADLSDDGQTLLFGDRFGVYMRKTDGSPPKYLGLTDGFADDFSPDGSRALATSSSTGELFILPTRAGQPRPLGNKEIASYRGALWCPDGRHIVFNGVAGKELRAYVQDVSRDPLPAPSPLTSIDTWALAVSPDGKLVAATQPGKGTSLWPMDGGPSRDLPGSQPDDRPVAFTADGQAVWVFHRGEVPAQVLLVDVDTGRRTVWKTLWPPDPAGVYSITRFKVTPGGNAYFYSYASTLSQLYLVRGLK
jgi:dipeptidyl aminopeptidase/acylaminoacyl peptidase